MNLEKILLVEGPVASHNYPNLNLIIALGDNGNCLVCVTKNAMCSPLDTKEIANQLGVTEEDVCRFMHCQPGSKQIECVGDMDGNLAKIRWICLTGFAGAKTA